MVVLEFLFSAVFYSYIRYSVDHELEEAIIKQGRYLFATYDDVAQALADKKELLQRTMKVKVHIAALPNENFRSIHLRRYTKHHHYYLAAYFPYAFALQQYLVLTADITKQKQVQNKVTRGIILMNGFGMIGIILYAFFLSSMLIAPIRVFSRRLTQLNERALSPLDVTGMPEEFVPLGKSINHLIGRIQGFLNYKKELFVGTAHELKTPLAVIKTKSQVTLLKKKKTTDDLVSALKQNIQSVDDMNKIISSILEFGRAEGAQFEEPETIDVVAFLHEMCQAFSLLASQEGKTLRCRLHPDHLVMRLPSLLLRQIVQNLLQNAIRFTPEGKTIRFFSYRKRSQWIVRVRDEGPGIDAAMDLFAPFKRAQDSVGAGLGLFLVKSASDALRGEITIKNRRDGKGAVATLILPL